MMDEATLDPDIARQSTMEKVASNLATCGFTLPDPPDFPMPVIRPSDLTSTDQLLYGQKYVQLARWETYCFAVMAQIDGWTTEYKNKIKRIGLKARLNARKLKNVGEKMTEKSIADKAEGSALYMEYADKLQELEQQRPIVEAKYVEATIFRQLFSRYLPTREGERRMEGSRRF